VVCFIVLAVKKKTIPVVQKGIGDGEVAVN
jgi:hypothetical protein